MARALVVLGVLALLASGCVGSPTKVQPASTNATEPTTDLKLELIPGQAAASTPAPTLQAPPQWRSGEWWKVKLTDVFDKQTHETTRVVAGRELDKYLVGMPADKFSNELMVIHLPGFGQVSMDTLGFDVHNVPFDPVQFPLTDGKKWDTKFEGRTFHAVASVKSDTVAEVDLTNEGKEHMHLTYDATVGDITKLVFDNYATYEVTDHGFDYAGTVTVPHMFHLVFQQSRTGPVLAGSKPAPPTDTVTVDKTFDRVSFVLLAGAIAPLVQPGAPDAAAGYYRETATGPDGKTYDLQMLPSDSGFKVAYFMVDKPGGTWSFQHLVGGPGVVVAEGIAYHVYDIELPSGHVMPSMGEHHHGG